MTRRVCALTLFCLIGINLAYPDAQRITSPRGAARRLPSRPPSNSIEDKKLTRGQVAPDDSPSPVELGRNVPKCSEKSCAKGYKTFQGKCYKVMGSETPVDFTGAQRNCQREGAALASDKSYKTHEFLKKLVKPHLTEDIEAQYRRAFIGLMCQDGCDFANNWVFADGAECQGNDLCDWQKAGTSQHLWNAAPTGIFGASVGAILDDSIETNYDFKLQPYPSDHTLKFMVCQKEADSTDHLKPLNLDVNERLANVVLKWDRPACDDKIESYIFVLLGGQTSYDVQVKCLENSCKHELKPDVCNYCLIPNTDYTFSIAAILSSSELGPAITVSKYIDVETCLNFVTPIHTISTCRGVSELIQDGTCEPGVTWSKGSMCDVICANGYGFFEQPAPKYTCDVGGQWTPAGQAPNCYEIVPVFSAVLQFKIVYNRPSIETLQHQFDGLVYKYNDIFCPYPEECGIGDLEIKSALDSKGNKMSEVIIKIDTPVYNITDQPGFLDLVRKALATVSNDNAFMTLIDYDNIELVLPNPNEKFKAEPMLCCHTCPEGHAYKLGNCVRCPSPDCK